MEVKTFEYRGERFPAYIRDGNAAQFIEPAARRFCIGTGLDVGCGKWPLYGSIGIDLALGGDAMALPEHHAEGWPYIFSSHCLEHLADPIGALQHWRHRLQPGGVLFLYLPHPAMTYWLPQNCRKHLHSWRPEDMARIVRDLGFVDVIHSERDLAWSFAVVGIKGA